MHEHSEWERECAYRTDRTLDCGFRKLWIRQTRVDRRRIHKEKVVDSELFGYVWNDT